jgi:hypothetical protein
MQGFIYSKGIENVIVEHDFWNIGLHFFKLILHLSFVDPTIRVRYPQLYINE